MSPQQDRTMEATLIQVPTHRSHRMAVGIAAVIVFCVTLAAWPYLTVPLAVVPAFVPIYATSVVLTEGLTAFLLWTQYQASGRFYFAALASSSAFVSVAAAFHLALYPGVFFAAHSLGTGRQTAIWIWLLWRGGFAVLVTLALAARGRPRTDPAKRRSYGLLMIGSSIVGSGALCRYAARARDLLPDLVVSGGSYRHLALSPVMLSVTATCFAALGTHLFVTRLRTLMDLWLAVALFAGLADIALMLGAGARYSLGWYAARIASMVSASALLGMLMYETSRTYSKLAEAHRSLKEFSVRDGLTGVFNRAYFDERYPREWAQAGTSALPLALLLVDVDHFKAYNDAFGHLAGDECLRRIAHTLDKALMHPEDFVARYGGEEFVIVLPACDALTAMATAERLRRSVAEMELAGPGPSVRHVTVSIGQASSASRAELDPSALLASADTALYRAKTSGRNRVEYDAGESKAVA
ncbi:sensor domain-containing diguanylate cyclase [Trinickia sp.]|uniref:sensor domain-containing diguanylate cyclase n=1 Tax=Trinickia sp. TaxID=2571163 RepID=UPI003F7E851E